jgi:hypothetical protein
MRVLVVGGCHPNERQATKIFNALKKENDNPRVSYEPVPFSETMYGYMNKALKLLLNPKEIEKRLVGGNKDERKISSQLIYIMRDDLKNPRKENRKIVEKLFEKLEEKMKLGGAFLGRFPEFENALDESVHSDFLMSAFERHGVEIGIDIHSSKSSDLNFGYRPFIFDVPKKGEEIGLNQFLMKTKKDYFISREPPQGEEPFYGVETPADSVKTGFSKYAVIGLMFGTEVYYEEFHDPNLPNNIKNFNLQKNVVKEIIDEIAGFDI